MWGTAETREVTTSPAPKQALSKDDLFPLQFLEEANRKEPKSYITQSKQGRFNLIRHLNKVTQKLNSVSLSGMTTSPEPSATTAWVAAGRWRRQQRKGQFRNKDSKTSPCLHGEHKQQEDPGGKQGSCLQGGCNSDAASSCTP